MNADCNCNKSVVREMENPQNLFEQTTFMTLSGTTFTAETPDENKTGTVFGKFKVTQNSRTIYLTNPSVATLDYYINLNGATVQQVEVEGESTPLPTNNNNETNQCEWWDLTCEGYVDDGYRYLTGGVEEHITKPITEFPEYVQGGIDQAGADLENFKLQTQASIDETINSLTNQFNLTIQQTNDAAAAAVKAALVAAAAGILAAQKAASDAAAATVKAAQDAANMVGQGAAEVADNATKGLQEKLLIGGGLSLGAVLLVVVATR